MHHYVFIICLNNSTRNFHLNKTGQLTVMIIKANAISAFKIYIMNRLLLFIGLLLLFAAEVLRVYFIMPFPGSQHKDTISYAYWLSDNIGWIRMLALALIAFPLINIFKKKTALAEDCNVIGSWFLCGYFLLF